jgi:hypothetical protein
MTVDITAFRVVARGNRDKGYRGVIEIGFHSALIPFDCGHRHPKTNEARDCIRKLIWRLLDTNDAATPAPLDVLVAAQDLVDWLDKIDREWDRPSPPLVEALRAAIAAAYAEEADRG